MKDKVRAKVIKLLDPVINYLSTYIKEVQGQKQKPTNPIGFRYKGKRKRRKTK